MIIDQVEPNPIIVFPLPMMALDMNMTEVCWRLLGRFFFSLVTKVISEESLGVVM